jgi:hypothetical protein
MRKRLFCIVVVIAAELPAPIAAAQRAEPTACGLVSAAEAQRFVGGPLEVKGIARIPSDSGPGAYDSICTYIAKGGNFEDTVRAARLLDLTLNVLSSADEMRNAYEASLEQYRQMALSPDAPYQGATITPLSGFGDQAFALQAVTDPKTGYQSALIVFYKGRIGGSVSAWKRPEPSLPTTKAVLKHILDKLP